MHAMKSWVELADEFMENSKPESPEAIDLRTLKVMLDSISVQTKIALNLIERIEKNYAPTGAPDASAGDEGS